MTIARGKAISSALMVRCFAAWAALWVAGCSATAPCTPSACGDGSRCVLGACQPASRVPVGDRSRRLVLFPKDVAAVAEHLRGGAFATLAMGARGSGDAMVFLAFDHGLGRADDVEAAYLVVDPADGSVAASDWVLVEARDVPAGFDGARVDWARRPPMGRPSTTARTRGVPGAPLRVDVTDLVRSWIHRGRRDGNVALVSRARVDVGATFSTGLGAGAAPRLEVYLR